MCDDLPPGKCHRLCPPERQFQAGHLLVPHLLVALLQQDLVLLLVPLRSPHPLPHSHVERVNVRELAAVYLLTRFVQPSRLDRRRRPMGRLGRAKVLELLGFVFDGECAADDGEDGGVLALLFEREGGE